MADSPVPKVRTTTIPWSTLCQLANAQAGVPTQPREPSYEFSDGRSFYAPADGGGAYSTRPPG